MSNVTLYVPENVKKEMTRHAEIRWSEVVRQALINKLREIRKLDLLRKYLEKEPFTAEDLAWMDENDWHPVDEKQMKAAFIRESARRSKKRAIKVKTAGEIFE